ncbi:hypothetical protein F5Y02DRAFT_84659 [Annulohypoxylon stygium]|nr:hypothetical protein F5Y02DRAFT_84659 [Annulohypoxylon stygium]
MEGCGGTQLGTCVGLYNLVSGFQVLGGISGYHVVRNVGGRIMVLEGLTILTAKALVFNCLFVQRFENYRYRNGCPSANPRASQITLLIIIAG